jgi:hypothetical protein
MMRGVQKLNAASKRALHMGIIVFAALGIGLGREAAAWFDCLSAGPVTGVSGGRGSVLGATLETERPASWREQGDTLSVSITNATPIMGSCARGPFSVASWKPVQMLEENGCMWRGGR